LSNFTEVLIIDKIFYFYSKGVIIVLVSTRPSKKQQDFIVCIGHCRGYSAISEKLSGAVGFRFHERKPFVVFDVKSSNAVENGSSVEPAVHNDVLIFDQNTAVGTQDGGHITNSGPMQFFQI